MYEFHATTVRQLLSLNTEGSLPLNVSSLLQDNIFLLSTAYASPDGRTVRTDGNRAFHGELHLGALRNGWEEKRSLADLPEPPPSASSIPLNQFFHLLGEYSIDFHDMFYSQADHRVPVEAQVIFDQYFEQRGEPAGFYLREDAPPHIRRACEIFRDVGYINKDGVNEQVDGIDLPIPVRADGTNNTPNGANNGGNELISAVFAVHQLALLHGVDGLDSWPISFDNAANTVIGNIASTLFPKRAEFFERLHDSIEAHTDPASSIEPTDIARRICRGAALLGFDDVLSMAGGERAYQQAQEKGALPQTAEAMTERLRGCLVGTWALAAEQSPVIRTAIHRMNNGGAELSTAEYCQFVHKQLSIGYGVVLAPLANTGRLLQSFDNVPPSSVCAVLEEAFALTVTELAPLYLQSKLVSASIVDALARFGSMACIVPDSLSLAPFMKGVAENLAAMTLPESPLPMTDNEKAVLNALHNRSDAGDGNRPTPNWRNQDKEGSPIAAWLAEHIGFDGLREIAGLLDGYGAHLDGHTPSKQDAAQFLQQVHCICEKHQAPDLMNALTHAIPSLEAAQVDMTSVLLFTGQGMTPPVTEIC
ncbi:hypothetical protein GC177_08875 [bacterium]|nr:hypothetical protein [bacterium]